MHQPPEVTIKYHFLKVPCSKIVINNERPWMARTRSEVQGGLASEDLYALQESIERLDVLDPLVVLYEDSPGLAKVNQARIDGLFEDGKEVEIVIGYRRLIALRRHLSDRKDLDRLVEVQLVLRSELDEDNDGAWELALTKIVASSNAFFKGYSPEDKLRITKNLYDLIVEKDPDGVCRHTDILNLMGEQSRVAGMQSSGYRASLRRFNIVKNEILYNSVLGIGPVVTADDAEEPDESESDSAENADDVESQDADQRSGEQEDRSGEDNTAEESERTEHAQESSSSGPVVEYEKAAKHKILDRQLAELAAKELGNDAEGLERFVEAVREHVAEHAREKRDTPAFRWRGYDAALYCKWIENIKLGNDLEGRSTPKATAFRYRVDCKKRSVQIPGVRLDIGAKTEENVAKLVEVAYVVGQLSRIVNDLLRSLKLKRGEEIDKETKMPEPSGIGYGKEYRDFIRRFKAEFYANPLRLAEAHGMIKDQEWLSAFEDSIEGEVDNVRDLELDTFRQIVVEEVCTRHEREAESEREWMERRKNDRLDYENRLRFLRLSPEALMTLLREFDLLKEKLVEEEIIEKWEFKMIDGADFGTLPDFLTSEDEKSQDPEQYDDDGNPIAEQEEEHSDTEDCGDEQDAVPVGAGRLPESWDADTEEDGEP